MQNRAFLALADGTIFFGKAAGAAVDRVGEVVFNTGMTGYQEIVSDPSYAGQIVTLTTAEVGNYGCSSDAMESRGLFLSGLIIQGLNPRRISNRNVRCLICSRNIRYPASTRLIPVN